MTAAVRRVAVLGTGTMGAPIARNLLRAGFEVRVWNRTPAKARGLAAAGALVGSRPAAAAAGVDVLITLLTDGAAVEHMMAGPGGSLSALGPGAVWVQMSTVGVEWADRLAKLAARHGVAFVDVPVSGSSQPAEDGQLVILASVHVLRDHASSPFSRSSGARSCGWSRWVTAVGSSSRSATGWLCWSKEWPKRSP